MTLWAKFLLTFIFLICAGVYSERAAKRYVFYPMYVARFIVATAQLGLFVTILYGIWMK